MSWKYLRSAFVVLLTTAALCIEYANAQTNSSAPHQTAIEQVDALFAPWTKGNSPGAAVIIIKDHRVLLKKGYGLAEVETKKPITPDTAFLSPQ